MTGGRTDDMDDAARRSEGPVVAPLDRHQGEASIPEDLKETAGDRLAKLLRATLGNIPVGGALVTELVGTIIPNLREDRVVRYLARLAEKLSATQRSLEDLKAALDAEKAALVEDGAAGAARATSDERIDQLATLVAEGLTGTSRQAEDQRAVVRLLNELTPADVRYLMVWSERYDKDRAWRKANGFDYRWEKRDGRDVSVGDTMDSLVEMYIQGRLIASGLLERKIAVKRGHGDELDLQDETVMSGHGLDLLRRMGLLEPGET